mgnify:CR=1 FL=1
MYQIVYTNRMKRDVRRARKRGKDMNKLISVLQVLQHGNSLPEKYRDHQLGGDLHDFRECHIEPDWLLIYRSNDDELYLVRTGTHSDLFGI